MDTLPLPRQVASAARLVHETGNRLRIKLPLLANPLLDFSWLQAWLESIKGVDSARINRHARSLIFEYDGQAASRQGACCAASIGWGR